MIAITLGIASLAFAYKWQSDKSQAKIEESKFLEKYGPNKAELDAEKMDGLATRAIKKRLKYPESLEILNIMTAYGKEEPDSIYMFAVVKFQAKAHSYDEKKFGGWLRINFDSTLRVIGFAPF